MDHLAHDTIARFRERGHVVIADLAGAAELERLRAGYDEMLVNLAANPDRYEHSQISPQFIWVRRPELVHDDLMRCDLLGNAKTLAAQLLDMPEASLDASFRVFHKPPRVGGATPWHQDAIYKNARIEACVHAWVPLDPVGEHNGHIRYISGSHKDGLQFHLPSGEGDYSLTIPHVDTDRAVLEPVPLGGAAFHHFHTVHRAGANRGTRARRVLTVVCETPA